MPKGYWIGHVDVSDQDGYLKYVAANKAVFEKFGGRFLVRAGQSENPEGSLRSRHVVLEFDSYEQAKACYHSPDYQNIIKIRNDPAVSIADLVVVEGYDG